MACPLQMQLTCPCPQVVSPVLLRPHSLRHRLDRHPKDAVRPQQAPGSSCRDVVLPYMHAIGPCHQGHVNAVIDNDAHLQEGWVAVSWGQQAE